MLSKLLQLLFVLELGKDGTIGEYKYSARLCSCSKFVISPYDDAELDLGCVYGDEGTSVSQPLDFSARHQP